jgi:hypothetical protein
MSEEQTGESKNTTKFGVGNPGKPKGAINKTTRTAKEAIALAAEGLGGVDRLIAWAKEDPLNERAFWGSIYPKLIPVQVANAEGEDFRTVARIELVPFVQHQD